MRSLRLKNFKGFRDSEELKFTQGLNLIVGQNNVGKSSILTALRYDFPGEPHVSEASKPRVDDVVDPFSEAVVLLLISGDELRRTLYGDRRQVYIPLPHEPPGGPPAAQKTVDDLFARAGIELAVTWRSSASDSALALSRHPSHGLFAYENRAFMGQMNIDSSGQSHVVTAVVAADPKGEYGQRVAELLRARIYSFSAQRYNLAKCQLGTNATLAPDARNLAEVLALLQGNRVKFNALVDKVAQVIPSVRNISVHPTSGNEVEVRVWNVADATMREDLAVSLDKTGTGVGQVLAMLYVVLTSDTPRTILIDEPASFLHPGAARKLVEILRENSKHQYIISTHSPEIIAQLRDVPVFLVTWKGSESVVERLDPSDLTHQARVLQEVGAKLADVYGYDRLVWVEGPTEEICFPLIARHFQLSTSGLVFRGVRDVGSVRKRAKRDEILSIYRRLSHGGALLPPSLAFIFDREFMKPEEVMDLERHTDPVIRVIPRPMYENYLLDATAIAAVLNETENFRENQIDVGVVRDCLARHAPNPDDNTLHGAQVLDKVFWELSGGKEPFRKTLHCGELTQALLTLDPTRFRAIRDTLVAVGIGHVSSERSH